MINAKEVAKLVATRIQESYRLLDDSAFEVRLKCSDAEVTSYVQAVGTVCAELIFKLMEPLYREHPELAPPDWDLAPEELLSKHNIEV